MAKRSKMTETELASLCDGQISDAKGYDEADLAPYRDKAFKYADGVMDDLPAEEGKSSVVSHDFADTKGWIKPGLMRIFLASDRVVDYTPKKPNDEPFAKQATDYVNYEFLNECAGYKVLSDAIDDGLTVGNGIMKHWWDNTPCYETESFSGLDDAAYTKLVLDDDVEVLAHSAYPDPTSTFASANPNPALIASAGQQPQDVAGLASQAVPVPALGVDGNQQPDIAASGGDVPDAPSAGGLPEDAGAVQPSFGQLHDLKIKRTIKTGRLMVRALPSEEFLIVRDATVLDETVAGCGHRYQPTRSELIKQGYKREDVEALPAVSRHTDDTTKDARDTRNAWDGATNPDKSMERVQIYEWYPLIDFDGDGIAERRKVVIGDRGEKGERRVLENEEWGDDLPFTDLVPDPVPHRWRGRSIFDETADIQRVKTVLIRQTLDNLYLVNNPQWEVAHQNVENMDAVINRELGGNVLVKAAGSITPLITPFVAQQSFPVIEYMDSVIEKRTGVSRSSMGLDAEALSNQSATAANLQQSASQSKVELYARNIAEVGLARLFRCLLKLIVKHQDKPKTIRLRDQWVEMDPQAWNAEMDVSVNVGLGAGNRDRDMAMLQGIAMKQELILQTLGPDNPLVDLQLYRNTLAKMIEVGGVRSPEQFFKEVTPEAMQKMAEAAANKPDPKMQELQAKTQMEQQKLQITSQLETQKMQQSAQIEKLQAEADIATQERKTQAELALAERRFQLEREMKLLDAQLKREEHQANLQYKQAEHQANLQFRTQDQQVAHHFKQQDHALRAEQAKAKTSEGANDGR